MALAPINPTQITPPRVEFIDPRSGAISREWYRFFLSLRNATQDNQEEIMLAPDTGALLASYDAMLETLTQATETQPEGASVSALAIAQSDIQSLALAPPSNGGTVTSVDASGGTTGLTFSGGPITTSGTLTLGGTLAVANGGTGQTSFTNGQLLIGNTTGNTLTKATLTAGTNVTITNGAGAITINATDAFAGTVTSVSVVSANGFAGTVANATTTPAITLSTSINGIIKGNGTALSAAVAATDYVAPSAYASTNGLTMSTSRLLGRTTASTGAAEEISVAGGLTLSGGVLTGTSGTVTSVTGTAPVVSSGGTTPAISMAAATASVNGYLTSTDWTTFNNKGSGSVTSVSGTGTVNGITLTGTVTTTGSLTLGGTLSGVSLTTQVSGVLPATNGGTGQSVYVIGDILYASTTTALSKLADVATGNALISGGVGVAPAYGKIGLTTHVSGTLPVANGGTGATTLTSGYVLKGNGTTAVSSSVIYDTGTNIGLGTLLPSQKISVGTGSGAVGYGIEFTPLDLEVVSFTADMGTGEVRNYAYTNFFPTFYSNNVERMRIDTSGNVGIGATSLTYKLTVGSSSGATTAPTAIQMDGTYASADQWDRLKFYMYKDASEGYGLGLGSIADMQYWAGSASTGAHRFFTARTERMRIDASGNVGVGTTANASAILDVQSTTKGLRLPNMTTVQKNAIATPAAGLMVFDTTLAKACVYSGAAWQTITSL